MKTTLLVLLFFLLVTPDALTQTPDEDSSALQSTQPTSSGDTTIHDIAADSVRADDSSTQAFARIIDTAIVIPRLDFAGMRLFDALTALARGYNLSIYIDSTVVGNITLRLDNVSLHDALLFIIKEYQLAWESTGGIIKIFKPVPPPPVPEPLDLVYQDGRLSVDLKGADLERVIDTLIELTGHNIIIEDRTSGRLTGKLKDLEFEQALKVILPANGFDYRKVDQVIYVGSGSADKEGRVTTRNLQVRCENGWVTIEAVNVKLADVISQISSECGVSVLVQAQLEGNTTAQLTGKTVEEALTFLLMNSNYTFKETGDVLFIGNRDSEDLYDTQLLTLDHLVAASVEPLIPASLSKQLTIKVVKEHNGLLVTGPRTSISRLRSFMGELDTPPAQVLFEVLLVDYTTSEQAHLGITANNSGADSLQLSQTYWPNIDLSGTGSTVNDALRSLERHTGWSNLGVLDDNFFIQLEMMQKEGKAIVQSHPQIATLNGHSASISIGTTQYYLLESETVYPSQQSDISKQTSQRFETVQADMSLVVTPFVSQTGDLIVEVAPEFSTPSGKFDPDIPPTLNKRVLKSTVRLRNGETIVLGGLIQSTTSVTIDKVPILGSIPILGRLFQNRTTDEGRSELMIYITPHVHFGSEGAVNYDSLLKRK